MTEREFLEHNIFHGLSNINNGYDGDGMWHFSQKDFLTIMERAEELGILILGIECWEKEEEKFTKYYEDYGIDKWHRKAYNDLLNDHSPCIFTATFDVPAVYLQNFSRH